MSARDRFLEVVERARLAAEMAIASRSLIAEREGDIGGGDGESDGGRLGSAEDAVVKLLVAATEQWGVVDTVGAMAGES